MLSLHDGTNDNPIGSNFVGELNLNLTFVYCISFCVCKSINALLIGALNYRCRSGNGSSSSSAVLLISAAHLGSVSNMLKLPTRFKQHYPMWLGTTQAAVIHLSNDFEYDQNRLVPQKFCCTC